MYGYGGAKEVCKFRSNWCCCAIVCFFMGDRREVDLSRSEASFFVCIVGRILFCLIHMNTFRMIQVFFSCGTIIQGENY